MISYPARSLLVQSSSAERRFYGLLFNLTKGKQWYKHGTNTSKLPSSTSQGFRQSGISTAAQIQDYFTAGPVHDTSDKGRKFLARSKVHNIKYSRGGKHGEGLVGIREILDYLDSIEIPSYYTIEGRRMLEQSSEQIQDRMRVKISKGYLDHALRVPMNARNPHPILKIVMPEAEEVSDLLGESDPSNQNRYSPLPGLLHKYEMLLAYVSINCSSHCRYCYRSDLFSGISQKSKADMKGIAKYIKTYNQMISDISDSEGHFDNSLGMVLHRENKEPLIPIREILFSGGDPLTLPNQTLARYLAYMADSGVKTIRLGTKELVFNPSRFDEHFFTMLDLFHSTYPDVRIEIIGHYSHPFEIVDALTDESGEYCYDINAFHRLRTDLRMPLENINARRGWLGHSNQFPIIAGVNDSVDILRLMMYLTNRFGITMHNIYACREIIGNSHFRRENDIQRQYELIQQAKVGLSGIENHGRLIMSAEFGKVEVVSCSKAGIVLKLNRFVHGNKPDDVVINILTENLPEGKFYWLTDEIISSDALSSESHAIIEQLFAEDNSFVKKIKDKAANITKETLAEEEYKHLLEEKELTYGNKMKRHATESGKITVDVIGKNYSKRFSLSTDSETELISLGQFLASKQVIEAACKCSLSCSTCVGSLHSSAKLPEPTEDEEDLIDSAKRITDKMDVDTKKFSDGFVRATCCVQLERGAHYTFMPCTEH